ncbi:MAG: hypothetical protein Kow00104_03710 [Rhodothalassiaceae bacterium]
MADQAELDEETEGEGLEGLEAKHLSGKKIVMIGGAVLLLLLIGGLVMMLMGEEKEAEAPPPEATKIIFIDLPELVVNLNTGERQSQFLRARISLEVDRESARAAVEEKMPRVIDDFQVYLRELRVEDLSGSAGLYRLKEELLTRLNVSVAPAEVKDVLFREMLVQ